MSNPLGKRNPLMSLWFSGANRVMGKGRAMAQAEARRQQAAAVTEGTKAITAFWSSFFTGASQGKRPKKRR
jgi:hypothetical protein